MINMRFGLIWQVLLVFIQLEFFEFFKLALGAECDYKFVHVNPFVSTGQNGLLVACLNESEDCEVAYAPPSCSGCDANCTDFEILGLVNASSVATVSTVASMETGGLICASEQVSVYSTSGLEWARASHIGKTFATSSIRGLNDCAIMTLGEPANVTMIKLNSGGSSAGEVDFQLSAYNTTFIGQANRQLTAFSFRSSANILMMCWNDATSDYRQLMPLATDPVYGWLSTRIQAVSVDCQTLQSEPAPQIGCTPSHNQVESCGQVIRPSMAEFQNTSTSLHQYSFLGVKIAAENGKCVGAMNVADGTGEDGTSFLRKEHFAKRFVLPFDSNYLAILSAGEENGVFCNVTLANGTVVPIQTNGDALVKTAYLPDSVSQGTIVSCEAAVMAVAEPPSKQETNLFGLQSPELWEASIQSIGCGEISTQGNGSDGPNWELYYMIGGAAGGGVVLIFLAVVLLLSRRKSDRSNKQDWKPNGYEGTMKPGASTMKRMAENFRKSMGLTKSNSTPIVPATGLDIYAKKHVILIPPSSQSYNNDDARSHQSYNTDARSYYDSRSHYSYNDDARSHQSYNNDAMSHYSYNDDAMSHQSYNNDAMSHHNSFHHPSHISNSFELDSDYEEPDF